MRQTSPVFAHILSNRFLVFIYTTRADEFARIKDLTEQGLSIAETFRN
jgi:hypothetical protein